MLVYPINPDGTPGIPVEIADGTGMVDVNHTFSAPPIPSAGQYVIFDRIARCWNLTETEPSLPISDVLSTIITPLAFRQRFTSAERLAIELAGLDDPTATMEQRTQAATIRLYQKDIEAAQFIDLQNPTTIEGVTQLETLGLLAAGRAVEILQAPVTVTEKP